MSARGFRLRTLVLWMGMILILALLPLGMVWKQYTYVNLSRALLECKKDRGRLQNQAMLLKTQVRGLLQPSRLESLARDRFGLIDPGPPIEVQPPDQVIASREITGESEPDTLKAARWNRND